MKTVLNRVHEVKRFVYQSVRFIGEQIEKQALKNVTRAEAGIAGIIDGYNNLRLHSA